MIIMLCGAGDTDVVRNDFVKVVSQFGAEPWHFLNGSILHVNHLGSSWVTNSLATVQKADVCVFVIVEKFGSLTWASELTEALKIGKPFIVLCLAKTYETYQVLSEKIIDFDALGAETDRKLIGMFRELEFDRQITIVPYEYGSFRACLRRELSMLFAISLDALAQRNNRQSALLGTRPDITVSQREKAILRDILLDDSEEKSNRKRALAVLATQGGLELDDALALLHSAEQGIQRLAAAELHHLYQVRPPSRQIFVEIVEIMADTGDAGVSRRLIASMLNLDLRLGIEALLEQGLHEVGLRSRLAAELEHREHALGDLDLRRQARELAERCIVDSAETNWKTRCRDFIARLDGDASAPG